MSVRGIYIIVSFFVACAIGSTFGAKLVGADEVLSGIVDVFSILAGVLIAVISIIGDPSMLMPGNWRVGFEHAKEIQNKLARFSHLFTIYILTIFLVLFTRYLEFSKCPQELLWVYNVMLSFVSFSVLLSLPLPYALMAIQKERMTEEIKRRQDRQNS